MLSIKLEIFNITIAKIVPSKQIQKLFSDI